MPEAGAEQISYDATAWLRTCQSQRVDSRPQRRLQARVAW
jgi:hypothetical protein